MQTIIRKAQPEDVGAMHSLIQQLAVFEKAPDEVDVTPTELFEDGFGSDPWYGCLVAEVDQDVVGMALYYTAYSTWKGKMIYLEDLIVNEAYRGNGIGKSLLDAVLKHAAEVNAKLVKWQVLDWNEPAIEFYKQYHAEFDNEWVNVRVMHKDFSKKPE